MRQLLSRRLALVGSLACIACGGSADGPGGENQADDPEASGGSGATPNAGGTAGTGGAEGSGGGSPANTGGDSGTGGAAASGGSPVGAIPEDVLIATDNPIHCTIVEEETVCWGTALGGETAIPVLQDVVALSSDARIRALTAQGDVYTLQHDLAIPITWEFTVSGVSQLAGDAMFLPGDGTVKDAGDELHELPPGIEGVIDAAAAQFANCYVSDDHAIACSTWFPEASNCTVGAALLDAPSGRFTGIDAGDAHFCAIAEDGSIACWGAGTGVNDAPLEPDGQCPLVATLIHQGQNQAPPGTYTFVSAGPLHTCAVRTDTTVACWGAGTTDDDCTDPWNSCGQSMPPVEPGFVQVSTGFRNSCGLKTDGTVVCWGSDAGGRSTPPPELQP